MDYCMFLIFKTIYLFIILKINIAVKLEYMEII